MSTEDTNKAVVTLHVGVDVDAFIEDMVSGKNHNEFMPNRKVELFNEKPDSLRNVDFVLTRAEAELLKQDPRIIDVRYGTKAENGIIIVPSALESAKTYAKSSLADRDHYNWAVPACINSTNPFSSVTTSLSYAHGYSLVGNNVDVVIQDSGILTTHPEWLNLDGTASRFQNVDWPTISGTTGTYTQGVDHYTDTSGHGTHVAGTVAGRFYGWAKNANIYAMKILDTDAFGASASFNMIRLWHTSKAGSRPTLVNMSWEYNTTYANITGGNYRGSSWTGSTTVASYGMLTTVYNRQGASAPYTYTHPTRVSSVDADITDCINAGVILVGASGNSAYKIDIPTGQDYDNNYTSSSTGTNYYHRGATPTATTGVICVGSIKVSHPEGKSFFSNTGPRIDVFAPGEAIQSAMPDAVTLATDVVDYPGNNNFKAMKLNGTSMASPQVAGVIACVLEARKTYTPSQALTWITSTASTGRLSDTGGTYTDTASLQSASNRILKQPFSRSIVYSFDLAETAPGIPTVTTITVTNNSAVSFQIVGNGVNGANATFTVIRGKKYAFTVNAPGHAFWIKTAQTLGTADAYYGVTNNGTAQGTIYFLVPLDAPSTLYYTCADHNTMQGTINVID